MARADAALIAAAGIDRELPGFALSRLGAIHALTVTRLAEGGEYPLVVELVAEVEGDPQGRRVRVRLVRARGRLPELDGWFGVGELFVDDVSADQLEGVRYHVHDEGGALVLYCHAVELALLEGP